MASLKGFPGYFIDRDADAIFSTKSGEPLKLSVRKVGKSKVVNLSNNGSTTTRRITSLRSSVRSFRDMRPDLEANVYSRMAKLRPVDIVTIRKSTLPGTDLAKLFGVSNSTISNVRNRVTWRWIK